MQPRNNRPRYNPIRLLPRDIRKDDYVFVEKRHPKDFGIIVKFQDMEGNTMYTMDESGPLIELNIDWDVQEWFVNFTNRMEIYVLADWIMYEKMVFAIYQEDSRSRQPTTIDYLMGLPPHPGQHKDLFEFLVEEEEEEEEEAKVLHVKFEYMDDGAIYDMDEDDENIWIKFDWVVLDWFKNYMYKMGAKPAPDEEIVRNLALGFVELGIY